MSSANDKQTDWKDGFLFLGNQLVLDFLNTCPVQNGEPTELLQDFGALLGWFQAANLLRSREAANLQQRWGESSRARRVVKAMQELREKIRRDVLAWERGGPVHHSAAGELNRLMADHPMRTRLKTNENGSSTELYFEPRQPEDLFAPLAHSAAMLFANVDRKRVRKCDECVLHFHDTSKKGTRRWCSMLLCGNRQKVAAYADRQRLRRRRMTEKR
ncbi:MAG: CGNR zinc finger domain-containing protein [Acidobacteriaceae bacterium]|nr:CGNR zinc finger domain-containing protein [Acidobacteriaceae bacterium]MBV9503025.1 CGNR zinc finger domain-containing protein [Acidobacteriaceae bacterium]